MADLNRTTRLKDAGLAVDTFHVEVLDGPDRGRTAQPVDGRLTVGTADDAALRLTDDAVSRYHFELDAGPSGLTLRDLGSTNGTWLHGVGVREARLVAGAVELYAGRSRLRVVVGARSAVLALSEHRSFGALLGASAAMRRMYGDLARAAPTTAPVLVLGESGTGKELAARALHAASERADQAFEVVDCGGVAPTLVESELFGHERGAFTGAVGEREGAFERADGGTLFLDELGEMPLDVQPKLLRALGEGEVRRVGGRKTRKVDVRVVAATNRDLRAEVNAGRFRADLFYRLAVITVRMPPLRERLEDLEVLVPSLVRRICMERRVRSEVAVTPELLAHLAAHAWPGNVRELRNYLEQYVILQVTPPFVGDVSAAPDTADDAMFAGLDAMPLREAKAELVERFERRYISRRLAETGGNVAEVARRAGVDRGTVFRTMRRIGMREGQE